MPAIFAFIVAPIVFFLIVWVAVTSYRIYFPDRPVPYKDDPVMVRERARKKGKPVQVGVREIRADQRRHLRKKQRGRMVEYHVGCGPSGVPERWKEDLWERRN